MYRTLSAPITAQWEVTPTCNHVCIHCYNFWRKDPFQKALPKGYQELYQIVVDDLIISKVFHVVITGGEPLVVIENIAGYIEQLHKAGITISMNSNLTLLTPARVELLKKVGVRSILVSLPSANPKTCDFIVNKKNSLPRIKRGIKLAIASGFRVSANMVVSQYNYPDIEKTAALAYSLGISNLSITRASNPIPGSWFADQVLTREQFLEMQSLFDVLREKYHYSFESLEAVSLCSYDQAHVFNAVRSCSAGRSAMAINFYGSIKACIRLEQSYGNITDGLSSAWLSMEDARSDEWIPDQCSPCKLRLRCIGGCRADALVATGSIKGLDGFCEPTKVPIVRPTTLEITSDREFKVNRKIRYREESFGGIILLSTSIWLPVSKNLFRLLQDNTSLSIPDLCVIFKVEEPEAIKIASHLVQKKFLIPKKKEVKHVQRYSVHD